MCIYWRDIFSIFVSSLSGCFSFEDAVFHHQNFIKLSLFDLFSIVDVTKFYRKSGPNIGKEYCRADSR